MKLVGGIDIAPEKVGRDLGEILDIKKSVGVKVVHDQDASSFLSQSRPHIILHSTATYLDKIYPQIAKCIDSNSKVIYSLYNKEFKKPFKSSFRKKMWMEGVLDEDVDMVRQPTFINLSKLAINMSDAIILGSETIKPELYQFVKSLDKPVLDYQSEENYMDAYSQFYDTILSEKIHDSK